MIGLLEVPHILCDVKGKSDGQKINLEIVNIHVRMELELHIGWEVFKKLQSVTKFSTPIWKKWRKDRKGQCSHICELSIPAKVQYLSEP